MYQKYDIIYSIGRDCSCSDYMKMNHLRMTSGPFDWLTNAGFEKRIELILNNFRDFLNPSDFKFLPKDPNIFNDKNCDYYENLKTKFYFYHDFPLGIPFEKSFPSVRQKYERRIQRFYQKLKTQEKVLLIWFSHYHHTPDKVVIEAARQICQKFNKTIDFLIIEHQEGLKVPQKTILADNIVRYRLHTVQLDEKGNYTTLGDEKLCSPIFGEFRLLIPFGYRLKSKLGYFTSKIICPFILSKKLKKQFKQKMRGQYV